MNYFQVISFFLLCLISCKPPIILTGEYKSKKGERIATLKLDSTKQFKYESSMHMLHNYSEGVWWTTKDTLYLKSNIGLTEENGRVDEKGKSTKDYFTLNTLDFKGDTLVNIPVLINDYDLMLSDSNGMIKYKYPIFKIFIKFYERYQYAYEIKSRLTNYIDIYLKPVNSSAIYFDLKKYLIKNKTLSGNTDFFKKL